MLSLFFTAFILFSTLSVAPFDDCVGCENGPKGLLNVAEIGHIDSMELEHEIERLANKLCDVLVLSSMSERTASPEMFEDVMAEHLKISKTEKGFKKAIGTFWNTNHDKLVCTEERMGHRTPQHFLKRIVDVRLHNEFLMDYLMSDEFWSDELMEINSFEVVGGRKETIVDYIDKTLTLLNAETQNEVTRIVVDEMTVAQNYMIAILGAKRGDELSQ